MNRTIIVQADPDQDDCLAHAADQYVAAHPETAGWELNPRWASPERETIALDVPIFKPPTLEHCERRWAEECRRARLEELALEGYVSRIRSSR